MNQPLTRLPSPGSGSPDGRFKSSTLPPPPISQAAATPSRNRSFTEITGPSFLRPDLHSLPPTPLYSPQPSSANVHLHVAPTRRLLMPTVRATRSSSNNSPRTNVPAKPPTAKLSRSRAGSTVALTQPSPDLSERSVTIGYTDWIGGGRKFEVVEDQIELEGFQIYAVEKWFVRMCSRRRFAVMNHHEPG